METAYQLGHLPWSHAEEEIAARAARPCLRDETVALTYDDFDRRVRAAAEQFTELGVGHGSVIALVLPNRVELLIAMLAAWRLGAAATPVNPALTASEADYQISDAGSVLALAEPSFTTSASAIAARSGARVAGSCEPSASICRTSSAPSSSARRRTLATTSSTRSGIRAGRWFCFLIS